MKKGIRSIFFVLLYLLLFYVIQIIVSIFALFIGTFETSHGINISSRADVEMLVESSVQWSMEHFAEISLITNLLLFGALFLILFLRHIPLKQQLGSGRLSIPNVGGCLLLLIGANILSVMVLNLPFLQSFLPEYTELMDSLMLGNPWLIFIAVGLIAPLAEEFLFRSMIYQELKRAFPVWVSILVSAAIFGLVHGNIVQGLYTFLFGIILAAAYEKTNSFKVAALLHIGYNCTNIVPTFNDFVSFLPILFIGLVSIFIGWRLLHKKTA